MATRKTLQNNLRNDWVEILTTLLTERGEQVLRVKSNEIAIPTTDSENNEEFIVLTVKVPTGSRDGELYDGYEMADDYRIKLEKDKEKAIKKATEKERKIARDKKNREHQTKLKQEREERG